MPLAEYSTEQLKEIANLLRRDVITMIAKAGSGHPAGSLGMADVFAALYFKVLSHNPEMSDWTERDRVILSNGHICPVLYATLARAGYFPPEELNNLRQLGNKLQGHPSKKNFSLMEASSGSLGHGLSVAAGMSLVAKKEGKQYIIWCVMSDAEHQEGSTWEAVMFSARNQLNNLKVIVDRNNIQLSGDIDNIMPISPLQQKYESFGWHVFEVDGHNIEDLIKVLQEANNYQDGPCVVLAKTIPGKGVSFMEGKWRWHGKAPNAGEAKRALDELNIQFQNLKNKNTI